MVERPARRGMADDEDPLVGRDALEEVRDPLDRIAIALAARERPLDPKSALALEDGDRRAVELAVVDLPQAPVELDRNPRALERDLHRLDGAREIGGMDGLDPVRPPARAELGGELASAHREPPTEPAGRDPPLVVDRERVGLEDEPCGSAHSTSSSRELG